MSFIRFDDVSARYPKRKTRTWEVRSVEHGSLLGEVGWFGAWHGYVFAADSRACIFEQRCLRDIADFVERRTLDHRRALHDPDFSDLSPSGTHLAEAADVKRQNPQETATIGQRGLRR